VGVVVVVCSERALARLACLACLFCLCVCVGVCVCVSCPCVCVSVGMCDLFVLDVKIKKDGEQGGIKNILAPHPLSDPPLLAALCIKKRREWGDCTQYKIMINNEDDKREARQENRKTKKKEASEKKREREREGAACAT
jgi:hypothetical protein